MSGLPVTHVTQEHAMKLTSLKPVLEPVHLDGSEKPDHFLRTPSEDDYCAWEDARLAQVQWADDSDGKAKVYRHLSLHKSTRALLVGRCLFKADDGGSFKADHAGIAEPVGEDYVRRTFPPAAVTAMYEWLTAAGFFHERNGEQVKN